MACSNQATSRFLCSHQRAGHFNDALFPNHPIFSIKKLF
ncbi:hypothetical protein C7S17_4534 [Burkholderia thailandensis]|nr:hypothetical protein [Burkholderia thailandensis]